jgi:hypothetical protein
VGIARGVVRDLERAESAGRDAPAAAAHALARAAPRLLHQQRDARGGRGSGAVVDVSLAAALERRCCGRAAPVQRTFRHGCAEQGYVLRPIRIEDEAQIHGLSTVINNVGKRAVIGANSVITRPIPAYTLAVGAPARPIDYFGPEGAQARRAGG